MSTIEKVADLQRQGVPQEEITRRLQGEGVMPKDINDAFNHLKIKDAVSPPTGSNSAGDPYSGMQPSVAAGPDAYMPPMQGGGLPSPTQPGQMQPSISQSQGQQTGYPPQSPEVYPPENPQGAPNDYYGQENPQDSYYPQTPQAYGDQDYYAPSGGSDTDLIAEIAEQVVQEKLGDFKAKTGDIALFKTTVQETVRDIEDRLKRIEASIDNLQQAIIGKIGEFGENTAMIHKDLENVHNTVSKLVDPLMDNYNALKKIADKK